MMVMMMMMAVMQEQLQQWHLLFFLSPGETSETGKRGEAEEGGWGAAVEDSPEKGQHLSHLVQTGCDNSCQSSSALRHTVGTMSWFSMAGRVARSEIICNSPSWIWGKGSAAPGKFLFMHENHMNENRIHIVNKFTFLWGWRKKLEYFNVTVIIVYSIKDSMRILVFIDLNLSTDSYGKLSDRIHPWTFEAKANLYVIWGQVVSLAFF